MPRGRLSAAGRPLVASVLLALLVVAAAVPLVARAADLRLASAWRTDPIRIDGDDEEWRGRMVPVEGQRFSLGVVNDGEALYLCLSTRDRVLATQIGRQGLIVWLDPADGSKKHVLGVHFPIDPRLVAARDPNMRWSGSDPGQSGQESVGILGPGKKAKDDAKRMSIDMAGGILARFKFKGEVLVYEMKIPLQGAGSPYAVPVAPGGSIRLELETPEWRGPLPPSRGPIGIGVAASSPSGRGVVGYPTVDATYLKPTHMKAVLSLASGKPAGER